MATIRTRKKADGSTGYLVQIRIYREKVTVYQESQTFARKQAAVAWAKRRETKLAEPGAIERATQVWHTVKEMIGHYLVEAEKARPLGETKRRRTTTWVSRSIPTSLSRCWWTMPYALCPMPYALWRMAYEPCEDEVLAHMAFPKAHRQQLHSTNPLERLNAEIKRRTES